MIRILVCFVTLFLSVVPVKARTVELMLSPAKAPEPVKKYHLLPKADEQTDSDAVPLYEKVVQSLPDDSQITQMREWLETPPDKLPLQQVQSTLDKLKSTLQLIEQATKCKECNWPPFNRETISDNLTKYRKLSFIVAVQVRAQIAQRQYDQAISTIRNGFAMARQNGVASNLIQSLVGVSIAGLMCRQLEQFVQAPDAPNLYWALQSLPRPLIDLNKQIELEVANLKKQKDPLLRRQFEEQLKPSHDRVRLQSKRLDRDVAALQCVEAIRLYAGKHDGKFPDELSQITDLRIPDNPIDQKPFVYRKTGSKATLEAPAPEGGTDKDALRYELNLKE